MLTVRVNEPLNVQTGVFPGVVRRVMPMTVVNRERFLILDYGTKKT